MEKHMFINDTIIKEFTDEKAANDEYNKLREAAKLLNIKYRIIKAVIIRENNE